jgi:hypothetical protein
MALALLALGETSGDEEPLAPASTALALAFWGLMLGAIVGAFAGALGHALGGRRHDFASERILDAGRYDVMAPPQVAGEARRLLAEATAGRPA